MNTKLMLIAASTLAITACGGSDTEVAETDENGAEVLLSEEQPQLEGDSPFVDGEDVAASTLDEERYDTGLDGPDLTGEGYGTDTAAELDTDASGFGAATDNLIAESQRIAGDTEQGVRDAANDTSRAATDAARAVTDGTTAKRYTANNTDAYVNDAGELITGSEAALLAGTYDVALPGQSGTKTLYVTGEGDKAVGTFDGEPIEVMVTGRNFSFDAPVEMDGETQVMTFAGTFQDGVIDNGVLEAQGDGASMTFTAVRTDADAEMGAREMLDAATDAGDAASGAMSNAADDMRRTGDRVVTEGEEAMDDAGEAAEGAYDRAADGSDRTDALGTDADDADLDTDADDDPNFTM